MTSSSVSTASAAFALPPTAPAAARAVFRLLKQLRVGTLDVQLPAEAEQADRLRATLAPIARSQPANPQRRPRPAS